MSDDIVVGYRLGDRKTESAFVIHIACNGSAFAISQNELKAAPSDPNDVDWRDLMTIKDLPIMMTNVLDLSDITLTKLVEACNVIRHSMDNVTVVSTGREHPEEIIGKTYGELRTGDKTAKGKTEKASDKEITVDAGDSITLSLHVTMDGSKLILNDYSIKKCESTPEPDKTNIEDHEMKPKDIDLILLFLNALQKTLDGACDIVNKKTRKQRMEQPPHGDGDGKDAHPDISLRELSRDITKSVGSAGRSTSRWAWRTWEKVCKINDRVTSIESLLKGILGTLVVGFGIVILLLCKIAMG